MVLRLNRKDNREMWVFTLRYNCFLFIYIGFKDWDVLMFENVSFLVLVWG